MWGITLPEHPTSLPLDVRLRKFETLLRHLSGRCRCINPHSYLNTCSSTSISTSTSTSATTTATTTSTSTSTRLFHRSQNVGRFQSNSSEGFKCSASTKRDPECIPSNSSGSRSQNVPPCHALPEKAWLAAQDAQHLQRRDADQPDQDMWMQRATALSFDLTAES